MDEEWRQWLQEFELAFPNTKKQDYPLQSNLKLFPERDPPPQVNRLVSRKPAGLTRFLDLPLLQNSAWKERRIKNCQISLRWRVCLESDATPSLKKPKLAKYTRKKSTLLETPLLANVIPPIRIGSYQTTKDIVIVWPDAQMIILDSFSPRNKFKIKGLLQLPLLAYHPLGPTYYYPLLPQPSILSEPSLVLGIRNVIPRPRLPCVTSFRLFDYRPVDLAIKIIKPAKYSKQSQGIKCSIEPEIVLPDRPGPNLFSSPQMSLDLQPVLAKIPSIQLIVNRQFLCYGNLLKSLEGNCENLLIVERCFSDRLPVALISSTVAVVLLTKNIIIDDAEAMKLLLYLKDLEGRFQRLFMLVDPTTMKNGRFRIWLNTSLLASRKISLICNNKDFSTTFIDLIVNHGTSSFSLVPECTAHERLLVALYSLNHWQAQMELGRSDFSLIEYLKKYPRR